MDLHLELGPPAKIVHDFEIINERWPDDQIAFDKAFKVGVAYQAIGEFERSYLVFRATVEGSFTRESGVAGFLEDQGEFLRSIGVMGQLLRDYPPEAYLAEAEFSLAERVYAKAAEAAGDPKLVRLKVDREALVRRASEMLEAFLTAYPADPAAPQAAFAAANALLELKDYKPAAEAAARYARRYPNSLLLDAYWYIQAYCDFATGQHASALEMCRKVAEGRPIDPKTGRLVESARRSWLLKALHYPIDPKTGRAVESPNKWRAIYIAGQIHQSLGQAAEAIAQYRRVEDRMGDAKLSIANLLRKEIALADCTVLRPGTSAEMDLKFRNIAECDVKAYRIDLMKFSQRNGRPEEIAEINLAGIRPLHEATVKLGDGKDYCDRVHKLALPLAREGAYLVVCRGEDLYASGLVLITPLEIESRLEISSGAPGSQTLNQAGAGVTQRAGAIQLPMRPEVGQIRILVKDAVTKRCVSGAQVRVTDDNNIVAGVTDLRGVFVARVASYDATVIAQARPGRYGFSSVTAAPAQLLQSSRMTQGPEPSEPGQAADDPFTERPVMEPRPPVEESPAGQRELVPHRGVQLAGPGLRAAVDMGGRGQEESERRINAALDSPTTIEFVETPLQDVVDYLKDHHHIEIQLDKKALDDAAKSPDQIMVSKNLKGISLRSALRLILDEYQLKFVIHNQVLLITTPEKAEGEEFLETKIYPVRDLVLPSGATGDGSHNADFESLIDLITQTVTPKSWEQRGGQGNIAPFENKLVIVISQTQEVHDEIADLLAGLRKSGGKAAVEGKEAKKDQSSAAEPDTGEKPVPRRAERGTRRAGNMGGGMGGMMGGMGGGNFGDPGARRMQPQAGKAPDADQPDSLLEGLQDSNRAAQQQHVERLKKRQKGGQNMGGMGGGMGAGGFLEKGQP